MENQNLGEWKGSFLAILDSYGGLAITHLGNTERCRTTSVTVPTVTGAEVIKDLLDSTVL